MTELVVVSGKGGTGKTTVVATLAALAQQAVLADCDVDAADLHLLLEPDVRHTEEFVSGHKAVIEREACTGCAACNAHCRFGAIQVKHASNGGTYCEIDPVSCEGCGVCLHVCPAEAVDFPECRCGELYVSETRYGPMVHARLNVAEENSGKLVTRVREKARTILQQNNHELLIVDGPPGIGCPVIASLTGVSFALLVTEPTLSGLHDLLAFPIWPTS